MIATQSELFAVLRQYNPWWGSGSVPDLPTWRRAAFQELTQWVSNPPAQRAVLLSGARQIGKTTLLLQSVQELLTRKTPPEQILYVTFDHPLMKLIGIDGVMKVWRETQSSK